MENKLPTITLAHCILDMIGILFMGLERSTCLIVRGAMIWRYFQTWLIHEGDLRSPAR